MNEEVSKIQVRERKTKSEKRSKNEKDKWNQNEEKIMGS